jgi:hypothetical protein
MFQKKNRKSGTEISRFEKWIKAGGGKMPPGIIRTAPPGASGWRGHGHGWLVRMMAAGHVTAW